MTVTLPLLFLSSTDVIAGDHAQAGYTLSGLDQVKKVHPWIAKYPYRQDIEQALKNNEKFTDLIEKAGQETSSEVIDIHLEKYLKNRIATTAILAGAAIATSLLTGKLAGGISEINPDRASKFVFEAGGGDYSVWIARNSDEMVTIPLPERKKGAAELTGFYKQVKEYLIEDIIKAVSTTLREKSVCRLPSSKASDFCNSARS